MRKRKVPPSYGDLAGPAMMASMVSLIGSTSGFGTENNLGRKAGHKVRWPEATA